MNPREYQEQAERTESPEFFGANVESDYFDLAIKEAVRALEPLDKIKKSLFYNRGTYPQTHRKLVFQNVQGYGENEITRRIIHGILGIATEAAELLEALDSNISGHADYDAINIAEECGDILWYVALLCNAYGHNLDDVMTRNIAKLRSRFPEKFTEFDANNRDLPAERVILEGKTVQRADLSDEEKAAISGQFPKLDNAV